MYDIKFHWTDLVICSHFREGKSLFYSQRNTVICDSAQTGKTPPCYEMKMHHSGFAEIYTTSNCR